MNIKNQSQETSITGAQENVVTPDTQTPDDEILKEVLGNPLTGDYVEKLCREAIALTRKECEKEFDKMLMGKNTVMLNSILERRFKDGQKEERQRILEMINKQKQDNKNNETLSPDDIDMLNGELDELKTKISEGKK